MADCKPNVIYGGTVPYTSFLLYCVGVGFDFPTVCSFFYNSRRRPTACFFVNRLLLQSHIICYINKSEAGGEELGADGGYGGRRR